jgi:hypothetical protein
MRSAIAFFSNRPRRQTRRLRPLRRTHVRRTTRCDAPSCEYKGMHRAGASPTRRCEPTHAARRTRPHPLMPRGFVPVRLH